MRRIIEKVRQSSEQQRHAYAFATAFALTLVVFVVWMSVRAPGVSGEAKTAQRHLLDPISSARVSIANVLSSLTGNIKNVTQKIHDSQNVEYKADFVHTYTQ